MHFQNATTAAVLHKMLFLWSIDESIVVVYPGIDSFWYMRSLAKYIVKSKFRFIGS